MKKIQIGYSGVCFIGAFLSAIIVFFSFLMNFVKGFWYRKPYMTGLDYLYTGSAYQKGLILASIIISVLIIAVFVICFFLGKIKTKWFRYVVATLVFALLIAAIILFFEFMREIEYLSEYSLDMTNKKKGAGLWLNLIFSVVSVGFIIVEFNATLLKRNFFKVV